MLGFVVGTVAFLACLILGVGCIAFSIRAERAERSGAPRLEVPGFLGVVDRLGMGQRMVVMGLLGWTLVLASLVWLRLGFGALLAG